jgi:hypothetical protein
MRAIYNNQGKTGSVVGFKIGGLSDPQNPFIQRRLDLHDGRGSNPNLYTPQSPPLGALVNPSMRKYLSAINSTNPTNINVNKSINAGLTI